MAVGGFSLSLSLIFQNTGFKVEGRTIVPLWQVYPPMHECWVTSVMSDSLWPHVCLCMYVCMSMYVARQALLSMGRLRQESCSGLPFPPPGDLPHPGIQSASLDSLPVVWPEKPPYVPTGWQSHSCPSLLNSLRNLVFSPLERVLYWLRYQEFSDDA